MALSASKGESSRPHTPRPRRHAVSAEGIAFHKEIQAAAHYLLANEEAPTEAEVARRERSATFARRVKRGEFTKLLDAATSRVLT